MKCPTCGAVQVPSLAVDAAQEVSPGGRLERRIVANLIAHLDAAGFALIAVDDGGDELEPARDMKTAMELVFNVDLAYLILTKDVGRSPASQRRHTITLVLGNGIDVISDWTFSENDPDGFNAAMEAFDVEALA